MKDPHGTFRAPPWYTLRTHKQRRRYRTLARRAGVNPNWVTARYRVDFFYAEEAYMTFNVGPAPTQGMTLPILHKREVAA